MKYKRIKAILCYLLNQSEYVSANILAETFKVSVKTIYRDLEIIRNSEGISISIIPNKGIKIDNISLHNKIEILGDNLECSFERRKDILMSLLRNSQEKTSIEKLSKDYYVSQTSIISDFAFLKTWLQNYNILLESSSQGTFIEGKEKDIRNAYAAALVLNSDKSISDFIEIVKIDSYTYHSLSKKFGEESIIEIEYILSMAEKQLGYEIIDPYYINIVTHLLILIERVRDGRVIEIDEGNFNLIKDNLLSVSEYIISELTNKFKISIPTNETFFIYQHLASLGGKLTTKLTSIREEIPYEHSKKLLDFTRDVINSVGSSLEISFNLLPLDEEILATHLNAALNRKKFNINIICDLKNIIKQEYNKVFIACKKAINLHSKNYFEIDDEFSEDEICYIVLYFQSFIENKKFEKIRVLVTCSSGVGISQLVMTRLQNKIEEIEIVQHISAFHLNEELLCKNNIDLIISTIKLDSSYSVPIVYISVLVNEKDISIIKNEVNSIFQSKFIERNDL